MRRLRVDFCATGHTPPDGGGVAPLLPPPFDVGSILEVVGREVPEIGEVMRFYEELERIYVDSLRSMVCSPRWRLRRVDLAQMCFPVPHRSDWHIRAARECVREYRLLCEEWQALEQLRLPLIDKE